jgi:hypothetical protein
MQELPLWSTDVRSVAVLPFLSVKVTVHPQVGVTTKVARFVPPLPGVPTASWEAAERRQPSGLSLTAVMAPAKFVEAVTVTGTTGLRQSKCRLVGSTVSAWPETWFSVRLEGPVTDKALLEGEVVHPASRLTPTSKSDI